MFECFHMPSDLWEQVKLVLTMDTLFSFSLLQEIIYLGCVHTCEGQRDNLQGSVFPSTTWISGVVLWS